MSGVSLREDHPVDTLPEYARGLAPESEALERHLAECETCRLELEILRALGASGPDPLTDVERRRLYRAFEDRRAPAGRSSGGRGGSRSWMTTTWRAAAAVAVLLTGVGVWRVVEHAEAPADWSPELALEGWAEDLADLDVAPGEIRLAFGMGGVEDVGWDEMEGLDPFDLVVPWEEDR